MTGSIFGLKKSRSRPKTLIENTVGTWYLLYDKGLDQMLTEHILKLLLQPGHILDDVRLLETCSSIR